MEIGFNASFRGLIYSVGYETQEECLYVRGNGLRDYELRVPLDGCGSVVESNAIAGSDSRSDVVNQLYVQNDRQLQEPWDDLFALRCERAPQQYRKRLRASLAGVELGAGRSVVASHPFGSYQAPICEMELQLGHGPSNPRVDGPVPFGQALTLVVRMAGTVGAPKYAMVIMRNVFLKSNVNIYREYCKTGHSQLLRLGRRLASSRADRRTRLCAASQAAEHVCRRHVGARCGRGHCDALRVYARLSLHRHSHSLH